MVAENNSSEMLELEKNIEKVRKSLKEPYLQAGKDIDTHAKTMMDPLTKSRTKVNSDISNYKTVQAAFAREKADKEQQELAKIETAKTEEMERITRVEQQLNARMYGGYWLNKSGLRQTSAGCLNETQCDELLQLIEEKVPKGDSYTYYGEKHDAMLATIKKRLATHKINVHNANVEAKSIRDAALEKIAAAKVTADVKAVEEKDKNLKVVEKEVKKESKAITAVVSDIRKGLKKTLKFDVIDPKLVTKEFWSIDEDKIRYYMGQHNEEIKEDLQNNRESLPGIKFSIDENYASS
jgi:hypothetical protein